MQLQPNITFRGIRSSAALRTYVLEQLEKLETYGPIVGCKVLVELSERHHRNGNRFHVRIDLTVPRKEIVIAGKAHAPVAQNGDLSKMTKQDEADFQRKHVRTAVREAFGVARRRLKDLRRRKRDTKRSPRRAPRVRN